MTEVPQPVTVQSSDRDERRLVASIVRLVLRLPRSARWVLIAGAIAGGAELSGGTDGLIDLLIGKDAELPHNSANQPNRSHRPDLRLERADAEALDAR